MRVEDYFHINGNYFSKVKYTFEDAEKISETLINCKGCIDCQDCIGCTECRECTSCTNCVNSVGCSDCHSCTECSLCYHCNKLEECINCNRCSYSKKLIHCYSCTFCEKCSECRELDFSYNCDNCFFSGFLGVCKECMYLMHKGHHSFNNFNEENTMQQIVNNLSQWRKDRNITKDMQRDNFLTLIQEELREYYEAKNVEDKIDALCDMAVITINSSKTDSLYPLAQLYSREITNPKTELGIQIDKVINSDFDDTETLNLLYLIATIVEGLSYDFILCMHETVKEISSRIGAWDKEKGKWIKDTSEEAKKMWYKADYKKCKINQKE